MLGDRVESVGAHVRPFGTLLPDNPVTESGVLAELQRRPLASRWGRGRADKKHMWLDPVIVARPWLIAGLVVFRTLPGRS